MIKIRLIYLASAFDDISGIYQQLLKHYHFFKNKIDYFDEKFKFEVNTRNHF